MTDPSVATAIVMNCLQSEEKRLPLHVWQLLLLRHSAALVLCSSAFET